jgi:4-amino-4-deoxy-L-arabinose transferase-like glycosyltransferase
MTLFAISLRKAPIFVRLIACWNGVAARCNPVVVIVVACAVLAGPLIVFRGYYAHEGLAVSIARTALESADWLTPHLYNVRFVERPTLQSWIIAAISVPFGGVTQITARLPSALFLLFGCLLIYWFLRRLAASSAAALLGAALFLASPLVMRSYVMITADLPLAVLLFFAFALWWNGWAEGKIGFGRWFVIGFVLAFAGLLKGPQPIAYFALGVGVFLAATRSWRQVPGLIVAGLICAVPLAAWYAMIYTPGDGETWAAFMRLSHPSATFYGPITASLRTLADTLPAAFAAAAFLIARAFSRKNGMRPHLVLALSCYAFAAAIFILFWPAGSTPRYYFPMLLPLCVFGGLAYDQLSTPRPEIAASILALTAALLIYALGYALASPLMPMKFRHEKIQAERAAALVKAAPATIYWVGDVALNILPYLPGRILNSSLDELSRTPGPAWMIMTSEDANALRERRPGSSLHVSMPLGEWNQWRLLHLDR